MKLNACLQEFQQAIAGCSQNQRIAVVDAKIVKAGKSAGIFGRSKKIMAGKLPTTQAEQNNNVRTALLFALSDQFGGKSKIPQSVLKALKGSSLLGRSDMKTAADGYVVSGRPLTARRIEAVLKAVSEEIQKINGTDKTPYWQGDFSASGPIAPDWKIKERLQTMHSVCNEGRDPNMHISSNIVTAFKNMIQAARKKGLFGESMVDFFVDKIKNRNRLTVSSNPDAEWFYGTRDETNDRLRRDVCRFLNLNNAYDDYWADPEAAVANDDKTDSERDTRLEETPLAEQISSEESVHEEAPYPSLDEIREAKDLEKLGSKMSNEFEDINRLPPEEKPEFEDINRLPPEEKPEFEDINRLD